jgi:hypothetical protein
LGGIGRRPYRRGRPGGWNGPVDVGDPLDLLPEDFQVATGLAFEHDLTFYDASYVAIASRMGRRVLSADSDLLDPGLAANLESALS